MHRNCHQLTVGIVGGGIAGLQAARDLRAAGVAVHVFDKGRAPGGRVATRRDGAWAFDHGAQFFTARDRGFAGQVVEWFRLGVVAEWTGPFRTLQRGVFGDDPRSGQERYCGVLGMSALARSMAGDLEVASDVRIGSAVRDGRGWWLRSEHAPDRGPFDELVLAVPPAQAVGLLPADEALARELAGIALQPCLAAMVRFERMPDALRGGMFVVDDELAWVSHDGGKPGRSGAPTFVLHATPEFSRRHFELATDDLGARLLAALQRSLGAPLPPVASCALHRWRDALPIAGPSAALPCDVGRGLTAVGDFVAGGRIEGAFCSGRDAALALRARHGLAVA